MRRPTQNKIETHLVGDGVDVRKVVVELRQLVATLHSSLRQTGRTDRAQK